MNDTLIFLVLAGLALIFKWLTNQGSRADDRPSAPDEPSRPSRPPPESEEERVRRFLEALGVPSGTAPPPPVRPRRVVTPVERPEKKKPRRSWIQPLPPLVTTPEDVSQLPPLTSAPEPLVVLEEQPATAPSLPPPLPAEVTPQPGAVRAVARQPVRPSSLGAVLRSPSSVRRAIVLREILGPPRGLEPGW